ncbi:hypothetical protein AB0L99_00660 [Streptomyces sp. NPDC051954]|uniref:hypothetical protein n=1 Tax=Streptomyces sp. NPDC051954 TaxID=3155524 RepID=UPI00341CE278
MTTRTRSRRRTAVSVATGPAGEDQVTRIRIARRARSAPGTVRFQPVMAAAATSP